MGGGLMAAEDGGAAPSGDHVKLPGIGNVKKNQVSVGIAVVLGIVGFAWWKQRSAAAAAAPTPILATNDVVPSTTYDPAATGDATVTVDSTAGAITTNAQWTQAAIDKMSGYGWDPITVSSALGAYLQRKGLTATQMEIVQTALGVVGSPPEGGPYAVTPATAGTPGTGATAGSPPPAVGNLHQYTGGGITKGSVDIVWDSPAEAESCLLVERNTQNGKEVDYTIPTNFGHAATTSKYISYLPSGVPYSYTVSAKNSAGTGPATSITVTAT
jgi:hypothetical protein